MFDPWTWGERTLVALLCSVVWVAGCAPQAPATGYEGLNATIHEKLETIGLGPGDVFSVNVYGEKALSGQHQISPEGTVDVPLIGRITVTGLTPSEIARSIKERLLDGYLKSPYVSVYVKEYNSKKIFVLGEVRKPGTFKYEDKMTIVQAVTLAGGLKALAAKDRLILTRVVEGAERKFVVPFERISEGRSSNVFLQPGDIVFVPESWL